MNLLHVSIKKLRYEQLAYLLITSIMSAMMYEENLPEHVRTFVCLCTAGDHLEVEAMLDDIDYAYLDYGFRAACDHDRVPTISLVLERMIQDRPADSPDIAISRTFLRSCEYGNLNTVRFLLTELEDEFVQRGTEMAEYLQLGKAIGCVCARGDIDMASLLLEKCEVHVAVNLFKLGCLYGDLTIVSAMIESHADVLASHAVNMLIYACARGDYDLAELLLASFGLAADCESMFNASCVNGHNEIVMMLVAKCRSMLQIVCVNDLTFNPKCIYRDTAVMLNQLFSLELDLEALTEPKPTDPPVKVKLNYLWGSIEKIMLGDAVQWNSINFYRVYRWRNRLQ